MNGQEIRSHLVVPESSHHWPAQIWRNSETTCNCSRPVMWNFIGICEMHYHMYCESHAQDVTVAATYMSWNIWLLHLDSLGYNQHQFCAVIELLKNHWFWFFKNFKIRESPASVFWKHQNQRTICPSYFKNLQLSILSLVIEDNGILLASLSHICKNRDKNTQCFNVS